MRQKLLTVIAATGVLVATSHASAANAYTSGHACIPDAGTAQYMRARGASNNWTGTPLVYRCPATLDVGTAFGFPTVDLTYVSVFVEDQTTTAEFYCHVESINGAGAFLSTSKISSGFTGGVITNPSYTGTSVLSWTDPINSGASFNPYALHVRCSVPPRAGTSGYSHIHSYVFGT